MLDYLTLKPGVFSIDISDLSLKIINLKKKKKFLTLSSFGVYDLKPGIVDGGEVKNELALSEAINTALSRVKGEKIKTKYVIASLPEEKGFLQVIQMPLMKEEEMRKAIYFEAESYIPIPIASVYLDAEIVESSSIRDSKHLDVLLAAMPRKIVDSYLSSLQKSGLKPLAFEIESQAVARSIIERGESSEPLLLLDLGGLRVSFIIFSGTSIRFTTSLPFNPQKPDLKNLVVQIQKYIDYYQAHPSHEHSSLGDKKVKKIILCGGAANINGLCDFLSKEVNLPVVLGNPWSNILPRPLKEVPELPYADSLRYATALGLALRGVQDKYFHD